VLRAELMSRGGEPVFVGLERGDARLHIRFPSPQGRGEIIIDRKRAFMINSHIFIVWVIAFSLLMVALAIGFLNQQVRSILRLSEAARAFGRGRDLPDFRPSGATEVRDAARALIDMKDRLLRGMDQRWAYVSISMWYGNLPWIEAGISEEEADRKLQDFVAGFSARQINWDKILP
jgi:two-component system osmolarity sensor histidine kinase EnvZ